MVSTHGYVAAEPPLGAPDTGGQVVYLLELSVKLAELGYRVDIWTRRFEDQPETEEVAENVRIIRIPCGGRDFIPKEHLYRELGEWGERALRYIRDNGLTYQFVNSHYWDGGMAGQKMAAALDIPHVHTPHSLGLWKKRQMQADGSASEEELDKTYNFTERIHNERLLYRDADMVIATSPMQIDMLKKDYEVPRDGVRMIPPGYDDSRFYPVGEPMRRRIRGDFGYEGPVVASIGRLSRNKGFDLLIDAFAVTAKRIPKARLRLAVGKEDDKSTEDPMCEELHGLVRKYRLEDRVRISGSLPDEAMADYYRAADVFAVPSRYEPFGMTAVEAMACGTPTVVTTRGGLYRTIAYGIEALYADPLDSEDFGIAVTKILQFADIRQRLSMHGARKVRSLFTWTGIAQQLLRLVEGRLTPAVSVFE
ncbi:MAG: glycosyltransferase [Kiritimatiellia bacterium]